MGQDETCDRDSSWEFDCFDCSAIVAPVLSAKPQIKTNCYFPRYNFPHARRRSQAM
jgi:hypothetical protein